MNFSNSDASGAISRRHTKNDEAYINPLPAVCDVSVTNVCNAACDFCGFARDKNLVGPRRYLDVEAFARALPILRRRRFRYMTFQGGEPLVHPRIESLVALAAGAGIRIGLITNGWFLPRYMDRLAEAGLSRLSISIDSADMARHEQNRGLRGLRRRIQFGIRQAHLRGIPAWASVTVSRLVNYEALPATLGSLGFDAVSFSFPRRAPFGSTSLVYDSSSTLLDMTVDELLNALQAIERLRQEFPVSNPTASVEEVSRFVQGKEQRIPCVGGQKYFYIDWNLDIWRCEAWTEPMGSVFDLDTMPDQREPCFNCMMACYRSASAMMHGAIALTDAAQSAAHGNVRGALGALGRRGVAYSLRSLASDRLPKMALLRRRTNIGTPAVMNRQVSGHGQEQKTVHN